MSHEPAKKMGASRAERTPDRDPGGVPGSFGRAQPKREREITPGGNGAAPGIDLVARGKNVQGRTPTPRERYLETLLEKAVNPKVLETIKISAGLERVIIGTGAAEIARRSCFRVQEIAGTPYILCPVPALYDKKYCIESGFAVDVNNRHFIVHTYMHDRIANKSLIVARLSHRACRPIAVGVKSYGKIKAIANVMSAIFFVNSLVADAAAGSTRESRFFETNPYSQLIDCLARITESRWINRAAIDKKFDKIMGLFENLDASDPFHRNNKLRAFLYLARFIFGGTDTVTNDRFSRFLEPATIKRHEGAIHTYVESAEFLRFVSGCGFFKSPLKCVLELFSKGGIRISKEFGTCIIDFLRERAAAKFNLLGLEDVIDIGRHPDYVTLYQHAASIAEERLGSNHATTTQLKAHLVACKLALERQTSTPGKDWEARFKAQIEVVSRAGAESIPFDEVEVKGVPNKAIGIVLDGIDSMADHPEVASRIADASTWFRLGRVFDNISIKPDAAFCYRAAIAHRPNHSLAWYNLHIAYDDAGEFKEARRCVEIALRANPMNPHAWNALGVFERNAGRFIEANLCYHTSLSLKQDIEKDPTIVETRVSSQFWDIVENNIFRLPEKGDE
nr:tetratricopeptide repeat protein [Candidatus Sigynarchaeum springense]